MLSLKTKNKIASPRALAGTLIVGCSRAGDDIQVAGLRTWEPVRSSRLGAACTVLGRTACTSAHKSRQTLGTDDDWYKDDTSAPRGDTAGTRMARTRSRPPPVPRGVPRVAKGPVEKGRVEACHTGSAIRAFPPTCDSVGRVSCCTPLSGGGSKKNTKPFLFVHSNCGFHNPACLKRAIFADFPCMKLLCTTMA
jgi:hypothetical protein